MFMIGISPIVGDISAFVCLPSFIMIYFLLLLLLLLLFIVIAVTSCIF